MYSRFESLVAFRHAHRFAFDKSDLFFVAKLRPTTTEIRPCPREIEAAQWMDIHEFLQQPRCGCFRLGRSADDLSSTSQVGLSDQLSQATWCGPWRGLCRRRPVS
jgi:hypothetical protein